MFFAKNNTFGSKLLRKKKEMRIFFSILFLCGVTMFSQEKVTVQGKVLDALTDSSIIGVKVTAEHVQIYTDESGFFVFDVPNIQDNFEIKFTKESYQTLRLPVKCCSESLVDLGNILLESEAFDQNTIQLSQLDLQAQSQGDNYSGILHASKDVYERAAAYNFSSSFYQTRGYSYNYQKLFVNGITMNDSYDGKVVWGAFGGLNDLFKNTTQHQSAEYNSGVYGGVSTINQVDLHADNMRKGARVSFASSNRSYDFRGMFSYASGMLKNNWSYTFNVSKRYGNAGYVEGTNYNGNAIAFAVSKQILEKHKLYLTAFYTPVTRGRNSANTLEVYQLKNRKYNAYWGDWQNDLRNANQKRVALPTAILSYDYQWNPNLKLTTSIAYQFGERAQSRLDYVGKTKYTDSQGNDYLLGGGTNPDPTYYQRLPSYYLRDINNPDYENAYLAQKAFQNYGQIDWQRLYDANNTVTGFGGNSVYAQYEDVQKANKLIFAGNLAFDVNEKAKLQLGINYRRGKDHFFARMEDLLGGTGYLDVDGFTDFIDEAQNNVAQPNRIVKEDEVFRYNYEMMYQRSQVYFQLEHTYKKVEFHFGANVSQTQYQRNGLYENGRFTGSQSFGSSEKVQFVDFGFKAGLNYKFNGRHQFIFNGLYQTLAPTIKNAFSNPRENNDLVYQLESEKVLSMDLTYHFRLPFLKGRLTSYYTKFNDVTQVRQYYADGLAIIVADGPAETSAFVQEVTTGVSKTHRGVEFGFEIPVTTNLSLELAGNYGQYLYANNPNIYLTAPSIKEHMNNGELVNEGNRLDYGKANLKNYKLSTGPQQAYSVGLNYHDPNFWWFGANWNYLRKIYVSISPVLRTEQFSKDYDGQTFNDFDPDVAQQLLKQEELSGYHSLNLVGGKSWKLGKHYVGFFATINNVLNTSFYSGGFEQSRNANYETLLEDSQREIPLFGSKYWAGLGANYYLNLYYKF